MENSFNFFFLKPSLRGHIHLHICTLWLNPISLSFKFESDQIHLRSSSTGGRVHLTPYLHMLKFQVWVRSDQWLLRYSTLYIFRSCSISGHLHLAHLYPLIKSNKLKFQIWVRSDQWLLRYSTFHILRSSFIGGHLHLTPLYPLVRSYKLKFQIWGRSDQWLLRYSTFYILRSSSILGRLPLKVIFIWQLFILWFGPISLSFKFE